MPVQLPISHKGLNQEEDRAAWSPKVQVCAVAEHLPHREQSIRAVGDHLLRCSPPVCAAEEAYLRSVIVDGQRTQQRKHRATRTLSPQCALCVSEE